MEFTVDITDDEGTESKVAKDVDEALDWFTNACTEVFEEDGIQKAVLKVDGKEWGRIEFKGPTDGEGESQPKLRAVAGGRA